MRLVELRLEQVTPAFVGYYKPEIIDSSWYLRPTSLKGIWRWTARALVAGVLYDLGLLHGEQTRALLRVPTESESRAISLIVGRELGLGFAGEDSVSSAYRLSIEFNRKPSSIDIDPRSAQYRNLQRLILLTLGKRGRIEGFERGSFTLRVSIIREVDRRRAELAVRTLVLALTLLGLGKGSRRGLGSFDVTSVRGLDRIERRFRDYVKATYSLAEQVIRGSDAVRMLSRREREGLPPVPALAKSEFRGRPTSSIHVLAEANWVDVHNFFVRKHRSARLGTDPLASNTVAWILGLPRSQRSTGYEIASRGVSRRASPILVSVHRNHLFEDLRNGVVVTFLASGDWPRELKWKGASTVSISVDETAVINALSVAERALLQYVGSSKGRRVWP